MELIELTGIDRKEFIMLFYVVTGNQIYFKGLKFYSFRTENPSVDSSILSWPTINFLSA